MMETIDTIQVTDTAIDTFQVLDPAEVENLLRIVADVVARMMQDSGQELTGDVDDVDAGQ
ncbi:MAG: hypothetical protein GY832_35465 [Chloroflexi bacterium]|nr:hypothetical protein [Chloroflexota bacterium]